MADNLSSGETSSLEDIAALLIKPANSPEQGTDDVDDQTPATEEDLDADDQEVDQDEADDTEGDGSVTADEDDNDGVQYIDINDDDVLEVMVDGKLETRTIAELKKAASGEGAIERRLQEATETRKTAHAERTTILEKLAENEQMLVTALTSLDASVFVGVIPAPNESLKTSNPAQYLRHKEAYDADQLRIANAKNAINTKIAELDAQRNARLQEYGKEAAATIAAIIPELVDPQKSQPMLAKLTETAKLYGYTDQEIASALDPRMFHLVRDAMLYRALKDPKSKEVRNVKDLTSQSGKPIVRKLRSGNTKATSFVKAQAKQQAAAINKARETGSINDVAATLVKPRIGGRDGRKR